MTYGTATRNFTDSIFSQAHRFGNKILIVERIDSSYYNNLRRFLRKGMFIKRVTADNGETIAADTFRLTNYELAYVDSFLEKATNSIWTSDEVNNAVIIPKDSIDYILSQPAAQKESYFYNTYGDRRILFLVKPIFLRDNTICLFQHDMDCGFLCGGGDLTIYQKKGGNWERYMTPFQWMR